MKHLFYFVFFFAFSFSHAVAQKTDSMDCPKIIIEGPRGNSIGEGQQAIFSV